MTVRGSELIARTLRDLGIEHIFGIVGIPVIEVAEACISEGIRFVSFRNEQSAVYAASIYGYLTGKPGVCSVVGGPGVVHALAGVENANANRFPLLSLAGSADTDQRGKGAFQQLDQISLVKAAGAKFAEQPPSPAEVPRLSKQAYTTCFYGKPGTAYIDLPADLIQSESKSPVCSSLNNTGNNNALESINGNQRKELRPKYTSPPLPAPRSMGDSQSIAAASLALKEAKFPSLIVGKGCAYARAEAEIRRSQAITNIGFIPTPMGKGVLTDDNVQNLSAARSAALKNADIILVMGARLNWILHFGEAPRFRENVKIIQVDNVAEESHLADIGILGDVAFVADQLAYESREWRAPSLPRSVAAKRKSNSVKAHQQEKAEAPGEMLKYHPVYRVIRETLNEHVSTPVIYVSEGANTMDISRTSFPINAPRTRLDAGTNATMGVGMGYAIAAKLTRPEATVVAIEGDSAFGFSAMEIETAVRSHSPMIIYVMNNSGVYHGADPAIYKTGQALPSTALGLQTRYDELARSLGGNGYEVRTLEEVRRATIEASQNNTVTVINVILDPSKDKKLEFAWMSKPKL